MIFWNLSELETRLAKDELSEKDALNYLIGSFIIETICWYLATEYAFGWETLAEIILSIAILIYGIRKCYLINSQIDENKFFLRFFPLLFVITIRLVVFLIAFLFPLMFILAFTLPEYFYSEEDFPEWFYSGMTLIIQIIFFWLMVKSFGRIKGKKSEKVQDLKQTNSTTFKL